MAAPSNNASSVEQSGSVDARYQISVKVKTLHQYTKGGNLSEILDLLKVGADIDEGDDLGNTAVMLSARYRHENCLKVLLERGANIFHKNHEDEDLFKIAVINKENDVLKVLVETLIEVGRKRWNEDDPVLRSIKQAIFEAASLGYCEKIQLLSKLNPNMEVCDDYGNTIFHYAAKTNMHEVITTFGHILGIDVQNKQNGDTPLHVACRHENHEAIIALLDEKANVSPVNKTGDNALHCFTRAVAKSVKKSERHTQVLEEYIDSWERRWFMEKSISQNHEDYFRDRIQAIMALTRETKNSDGESVLALAFRIGSVPVIEKVLSIDKVFCFHQKEYFQHDITQMTPRSFKSTSNADKTRKSYLELLLENKRDQTIAQVLNVEPLKNIEVMYSTMSTFIYLIVIVLHVLYMSLFSYTSIVLMDRVREHPGNYTIESDVKTVLFYGVVPIEPLFFLISLVYRFHCFKMTWENMKFRTRWTYIMQWFSIIHHIIYISLVVALLYKYYNRDVSSMHNTMSVTLLIGWLTTLSFTQGLKPIRFFWRSRSLINIKIRHFIIYYVFRNS